MELKTWLMDKCPMDYRPHGLLSTWTTVRIDDYPKIPMDDCHLAISGDKKEFNLMRIISMEYLSTASIIVGVCPSQVVTNYQTVYWKWQFGFALRNSHIEWDHLTQRH